MKKNNEAWMSALVGAVALLFLAGPAYCDDAMALAPPVDQGAVAQPADNSAPVNQDQVFQWTDVPQNQNVPIQRAVFDQGGYQLYDTVGETIVVPFANNNLYVMKFAVSPDGTMYFVNTGDAPVLYVPTDGYLENATVAGARWYPFSTDFQPSDPVYCGIAPSWPDYCDMYWAPDMSCYGSYWCDTAFGIFAPCGGFFFDIGGYPYFGWGGYLGWGHGGGFRTGFWNRGIYGHGGHGAFGGGRAFRGAGRNQGANRSFGSSDRGFAGGRSGGAAGGHVFRGASGGFGGRDAAAGGFSGHESFGGGGGHVFRGASGSSGGSHFGGGESFGGSHFGGGESFGGSHFGGGESFGGSHFGGGGSFSGGHFGGGESFGGGHFGGGESSGGSHFGGGSFGGSHFGGGGSFGGGHFGGGGSSGGSHFGGGGGGGGGRR